MMDTALSATFEDLRGVAGGQLGRETADWADRWERNAPLPGVARWIGQRIRRTEKILGSGAAETGFLIGELGAQAVDQISQLDSEEREDFFAGMNEAARLFVRGLRRNRTVPEPDELLSRCERELAGHPDAREAFSRAVETRASILLPNLPGCRPLRPRPTLSIDGRVLAPGTENLIAPVIMYFLPEGLLRSKEVEELGRVVRQNQDENVLLVAPNLDPAALQDLTSAAQARCWVIEPTGSKGKTDVLWQHVAPACEEIRQGWLTTYRCPCNAAGFEPEGAFILGAQDWGSPKRSLGLTAPLEADNPGWTRLDRTFRLHREILKTGCVAPATLSRAADFLRERMDEIPIEQIPGAQAVLEAAEELGARGSGEPVPLSVVQEALEGATEAVTSLLTQSPQAAAEGLPRPDLIPLTHPIGFSASVVVPEDRGEAPGPGDSDDDPPGPGEQERVLDVLVTGEIWEGMKVTLTATVRLPTSEPAGQLQRTFGVAPSLGPVRFRCEVSGFELLTPPAVLRVIPDAEDAETVTFILRVVPAPSRWIELTLFQEQKLLTQVTINEFHLAEIARRQVLRQAGEVDLMVTVDEDGKVRADSPKDREDLSDFAMGAFTPWDIDYQTRLAAEIARLFDQEDPRKVERELRYIGAELRSLMPPSLVEKLASPRVRTVFVRHGVANAFPFEFVLLDDGQEEFFLGDRLAICRWLRGIENAPRSDAKEIHRVALLKGNVDVAQREVDLLQGFCAETRVFASPESVREEVLARQSFELLHFIGHCKCSEKGQSCLELEEGDLRLREIGTLREYQAFGEASPFVFLNGCGTAHPGYSLFGPDSFPHRFLQHNASVFLGTLWPVSKTVAHDFSRAFYGRLVQGIPLGQALIESRQKLLGSTASSEDLIRLRISLRSYCLFAHPAMRVAFQRAA